MVPVVELKVKVTTVATRYVRSPITCSQGTMWGKVRNWTGHKAQDTRHKVGKGTGHSGYSLARSCERIQEFSCQLLGLTHPSCGQIFRPLICFSAFYAWGHCGKNSHYEYVNNSRGRLVSFVLFIPSPDARLIWSKIRRTLWSEQATWPNEYYPKCSRWKHQTH